MIYFRCELIEVWLTRRLGRSLVRTRSPIVDQDNAAVIADTYPGIVKHNDETPYRALDEG